MLNRLQERPMIDITNETLVQLSEAAGLLPGRRGKKLHVSTLYRWVQRGVRGVRLETVLIGGSRLTSVEAIERFVDRLSSPPVDDAPPIQATGVPASGRAIAAAEASLRANGFRFTRDDPESQEASATRRGGER
jgi:hypothetical protein